MAAGAPGLNAVGSVDRTQGEHLASTMDAEGAPGSLFNLGLGFAMPADLRAGRLDQLKPTNRAHGGRH
jgi:hypothetical protein